MRKLSVILSIIITTSIFALEPTNTSGMYFPPIKTPPAKIPSPPPPVCVESGIAGKRCGISAINFCKNNPTALNCPPIANEKKDNE